MQVKVKSDVFDSPNYVQFVPQALSQHVRQIPENSGYFLESYYTATGKYLKTELYGFDSMGSSVPLQNSLTGYGLEAEGGALKGFAENGSPENLYLGVTSYNESAYSRLEIITPDGVPHTFNSGTDFFKSAYYPPWNICSTSFANRVIAPPCQVGLYQIHWFDSGLFNFRGIFTSSAIFIVPDPLV